MATLQKQYPVEEIYEYDWVASIPETKDIKYFMKMFPDTLLEVIQSKDYMDADEDTVRHEIQRIFTAAKGVAQDTEYDDTVHQVSQEIIKYILPQVVELMNPHTAISMAKPGDNPNAKGVDPETRRFVKSMLPDDIMGTYSSDRKTTGRIKTVKQVRHNTRKIQDMGALVSDMILRWSKDNGGIEPMLVSIAESERIATEYDCLDLLLGHPKLGGDEYAEMIQCAEMSEEDVGDVIDLIESIPDVDIPEKKKRKLFADITSDENVRVRRALVSIGLADDQVEEYESIIKMVTEDERRRLGHELIECSERLRDNILIQEALAKNPYIPVEWKMSNLDCSKTYVAGGILLTSPDKEILQEFEEDVRKELMDDEHYSSVYNSRDKVKTIYDDWSIDPTAVFTELEDVVSEIQDEDAAMLMGELYYDIEDKRNTVIISDESDGPYLVKFKFEVVDGECVLRDSHKRDNDKDTAEFLKRFIKLGKYIANEMIERGYHSFEVVGIVGEIIDDEDDDADEENDASELTENDTARG